MCEVHVGKVWCMVCLGWYMWFVCEVFVVCVVHVCCMCHACVVYVWSVYGMTVAHVCVIVCSVCFLCDTCLMWGGFV